MPSYTEHIDKALVDLLKDSNQNAFKEIYNRYNGLLFAYAFKRLQVKDEAKDVIQEVFIGLWENREHFILKTYLSGFLYKSVLNKILNIWKHKRVIRHHVLSQALQLDVDSVETDFLIREKDIAALVEKEIAAMPPRMREIYGLKYKQYLSVKQIATELNISENTVATQLQRASAHLKNKLGLLIFVIHILQR
ncbi:sigma-70 family RNA polymerase sigma factor [Pedobacter sp. FW305-3-2-15-E-R2A2]|uniref:RNA polymerase sigma factor n=1 Tax=Pedobacter sp. FW305-3-2-15-E-R2A2 TaxID=3140251 RepID=UPI0031406AB4